MDQIKRLESAEMLSELRLQPSGKTKCPSVRLPDKVGHFKA